jgi:predicted transcriptional regulator
MKMNSNLLRSKMILEGHQDKDLAELIGLSAAVISTRLKGTTRFDQSEIAKIIRRYGLTPEETHEIFFAEK